MSPCNKQFRLVVQSLGLMVALSATLVGCANKLLVTSEPSGANVTVIDSKGKVVVSGPSPLEAEVSYPEKKNNAYTIDIQPTAEQLERFLPTQRRLTTAEYYMLPDEGKGKRLNFKLTEREYVSIPVIEVSLTPTGEWVGVVTRSRSFKDIAEAGGAVPALVVDFGVNRGIQGLALSPDGQRIVYSEAVYDLAIDNLDAARALEGQRILALKGANLRGINILGGGIQHITTENFLDMFPAFTPVTATSTPASERLLFSSNRRRQLLDILGIRATGRSGISNIYVNHRDGMALKPTAAKDGTIAFAIVNIDPATYRVKDSQVWTHYGPNEFPTQITLGREPAISPDGAQIAYIGTDGNLWVIRPDGTGETQLTFGAAEIVRRYEQQLTNSERLIFEANKAAGVEQVAAFRYPSWTPDGDFILYTSMEGTDPTGRPNEDIWIMAADGTDKQQLTTNGSADRFPLMSPDGKMIYFLSNRGESWAIWRIANGPLQ